MRHPPAVEEMPPTDAPAERVLPEIEHPIGPLRQAVLDALLDSEGPRTVSQILAKLPVGTSRNTAESAIKRNFDAGLIERIAPGTYVLAKPKPPKPPKPPPEEEALLFAALEDWALDPSSWDVEKLGPPPDDADSRISLDIRTRFFDRVRKREQRRRDAEAAAAKQAAADRELRDKLIAATHGNFQPGPGLDDLGAIKAALELVPLDSIVQSIRSKTDRRIYPPNEPATSWREPRLLKKIAEDYCRFNIVPSMVKAWSEAGKAPGKPAGASGVSPAVQVPAAPEEDRNGQIRP
jgi:hypothetical protein